MANFFTDRSVENPGRYRLNPTGISEVYDLIREEGTIYNQGTPLNAENLNNAMQDVIDQIPTDCVARSGFEADIDTSAAVGTTDGNLYNAINAVGWVSNVISGSNLLVKKLLTKILEALKVDYIVAEGTVGTWGQYRKWASGKAEYWYHSDVTGVTTATWVSPICYGDYRVFGSIWSGVFNAAPFSVTMSTDNTQIIGVFPSTYNANGITAIRFLTCGTRSNLTVPISIYAYGTWK